MKPYTSKYILSLVKAFLVCIGIIGIVPLLIRIALADYVETINSMITNPYLEDAIFDLDSGWFFDWLGKCFLGDLESIVILEGVPIGEIISAKRGISAPLILCTLLFSSLGGIPLGILSKRVTHKPSDLLFRTIMAFSVSIISLIAVYLKYSLGQHIILFPPSDREILRSYVLYVLSLITSSIGIVIWVTRNMRVKSRDTEFNAHKWIISGMVGLVIFLVLIMAIDGTFRIRGTGDLFIDAYNYGDYPIFITMIMNFVFNLVAFYFLLSVLAYTIRFVISEKEANKKQETHIEEGELNLDQEPQLFAKNMDSQSKNYPEQSEKNILSRNRLSFALSITSLCILVGVIVYFIVVGSKLANWEDIFGNVFVPEYGEPSIDHPWGTGENGRDLFQTTNLGLLSLLAHIGIISVITFVFGGVLIAGYVLLRGLKNQNLTTIFTDIIKDLAIIGIVVLGFVIFFLREAIGLGSSEKFLTPYAMFYIYTGLLGGLLCFSLFTTSKKLLIGRERFKTDFKQKIPQISAMSIIFSVMFMFYYQCFNFLGQGLQEFSLGQLISDHKSHMIDALFATIIPLVALILLVLSLTWSITTIEHTMTLYLHNRRDFSLRSQE